MSRVPVIYQESRLSVAPASPAQILHINTDGSKQSAVLGAGRKRNFDEISGLDEEAYSRKYLATEASIFFRRSDRAPRNFLWRVLDEGKLLEIQSVDLIHDARGAGKDESRLTFRIVFKDAIIKNGVAFGDPNERDALDCFVLTSGKELITITLKKDLLTKETAPTDFDSNSCVKRYSPSIFHHRHVYRFVALSSLELLVTLHDGGFLRLERKPNEDGAQWHESLFSEQSWGNTLRGIMSLKRPQTVRSGDVDLYPNAIAAAAKSPDGKHLWTVSLEHDLRVWDTRTGKALNTMDLLNEEIDDETRRQPRQLMGAEQGSLIQVLSSPPPPDSIEPLARMPLGYTFAYYIVVHSPKEHEFKIYGVNTESSAEGEVPRIEDLQPGVKMIPPIDDLLNTNVWNLQDFFVQPGPGWQDSKFWIRARNGPTCRIFAITLDLFNLRNGESSIQQKWSHAWTVVDPGHTTSERLKECVDFPGFLENVAYSVPTVSEKWLDYLFRPGRFSEACLESAVHIYRKARKLQTSSDKSLSKSKASLRQRLSQAIESKVILIRNSDDQPDFARYASDIQAQWKTFFSLLSHLHKKRNEPVGLAFDPHDDLAWSLCADLVGPICEGSPFHLLQLNTPVVVDELYSRIDADIVQHILSEEDDASVTSIMVAAKAFRSSLSADFCDKFTSSILTDALTLDLGDTEASSQHVNVLYEAHNFSEEVVDDDFQALTDAAEAFGGLGSLDLSSFLAVLEKMDAEDEQLQGRNAEKLLTRYGDRLTIGIVQETMERHLGVLLDVLNLVVFMVGDLDQEELHADFVAGTGELLEAALMRIKHTELVLWLVGNLVPEPQKSERRKSLQRDSNEPKAIEPVSAMGIPLLLILFVAGWKAISADTQSLAPLLPMWSRSWIHELDLSRQWDDLTAYVFSSLLKHGFNELATDFKKYLSQGENANSWLYYLEGRYCLAIGDLPKSGHCFRAASDGMATIRTMTGVDRAHLLSAEQLTFFGTGSSRYFQHIARLYESQRIFSYVADFSTIALARRDEDDDLATSLAGIDKRKALKDSPVAHRIEDTMEEIRILKLRERVEEIRNRLFNALVQTERFREAWQCLVHLGDTRKSNLSMWLKKVVESEAMDVLLDVSGTNADASLQEVDAVLLGLAKKATSSSSAVPYHQILYSFRTQRGDFRGAAEILHEHLERLLTQKGQVQDPEDDTIIHAYVLLINTLSCCGDEDAWLLAEAPETRIGKRRLVTLADIRRDYTAELDRRSDVLMGRFPLVGGDEMDVL